MHYWMRYFRHGQFWVKGYYSVWKGYWSISKQVSVLAIGYCTRFSVSLFRASLDSMHALVSRNAFLWDISVGYCVRTPARFAHMNSKTLAISWKQQKEIINNCTNVFMYFHCTFITAWLHKHYTCFSSCMDIARHQPPISDPHLRWNNHTHELHLAHPRITLCTWWQLLAEQCPT